VPESAKEDATGLAEGSDIGLGAGDRGFESRHSDHNPTLILIESGWDFSFLYLVNYNRIRRFKNNFLYFAFCVV